MPRAGLNGNYHQNNHAGRLRDMGVKYLGEGEWVLPRGAEIEQQADGDWLLTMPEPKANGGVMFWHVWTEE